MSRDKEFRARDKKVHKMTKDGLIEQNQTAGTQERISQRLADVSFDKAHPPQEAIGRSANRKQASSRSNHGAKPVDFVECPPDIPPSQERFADTVLSPDWEPEPPALSMRGASDMPMFAPPPTVQPEIRSPPHRGKHRGKDKAERDTKPTQHSTEYQAKFAETISTAPHSIQEHGRLNFDNTQTSSDVTQGKPPQRGTQYQEKFATKSETETLSESPLSKPSSRAEPEHGRLQFDSAETSANTLQGKPVQRGTRYQAKFIPKNSTETPLPELSNGAVPERGRLHFDKEDTHPDSDLKRAASKNRQAAHFAADAAKPEGTSKLRYDKSELPPDERAIESEGTSSAKQGTADTREQTSSTSRQQKKLNKAEQKVRSTDEKLEKAKAKLPTKRRIKLEKQYDSEAGKVKRRLQFEKEVIPQGTKPHIIKRGAKALITAAPKAAVLKAHQKIHEVEREM